MDDRRITIDELREQQRAHWPEVYAISSTPLLRLIRFRDFQTRHSEARLRTLGLLPAEFDILATLRRQPPPHTLSPTSLRHALLVCSGGLTKMLNRLQTRKLISRPTNPEDGRSLLVQLTPAGKQNVESAVDLLADFYQRQTAALTEQEMDTLDRLLNKLLVATVDTTP